MPWRHGWARPYNGELAGAMKRAGFNGGVCDFIPQADADLHDAHGLLWYLDHAAGKGVLHLSDEWNTPAYRGALRRPRCLLEPDVRDALRRRLTRSVTRCTKHPTRVAYALDDEVSWSTLTNPCRWDNHPLSIRGFKAWLLARYGTRGAILRQWGKQNEGFLHRMATPDDFQHLYRQPVTHWNLSPWCDALSYMDSELLDLVGELVVHANTIDRTTPCGLVGAQGPAPYGGYDYAKLMRKVQFLEVYNIGAAMEIARSLNRRTQMPLVTGGVGDIDGPDGAWWLWYGLAHGYRGSIVFADGWFGPDKDMRPLGPEVRKLERVSRKLVGARWRHDGVAVYYSHPSIQVGWFIDCHPHGRTWINRLSSMNNRLASSNAAFWAWTRLLEDARLQYDFVTYADVAARGLDPSEYKVLILPRVLALSDVEAEQITRYVARGGVLIADHMVGLFDHHGRGRQVPALDELLGVTNHPPVTAGNVFGGRLLSEFDPEAYWNDTFLRAGADIWPKCLRARGLPVAERRLGAFIAAPHGKGWATLMNVSLAEYCLHRARQSPKATEVRRAIVGVLRRAGIRPRLALSVGDAEPPMIEATYWGRAGRLYVCVVRNPSPLGDPGGVESVPRPGSAGAAPGGTGGSVRLTLRFAEPQTLVIDEVAQEPLGDGQEFERPWRMPRAVVLSMDAEPAGATTRPASQGRQEK